jgi:hypothetical protein
LTLQEQVLLLLTLLRSLRLDFTFTMKNLSPPALRRSVTGTLAATAVLAAAMAHLPPMPKASCALPSSSASSTCCSTWRRSRS